MHRPRRPGGPRPSGAAGARAGGTEIVRAPSGRALHLVAEESVAGLGYELVDAERLALGLLRITIDRLPGRAYASGEGDSVTVDDCEQVTRQLQYAFEVEGIDYRRLEVSSPGLDRPLRTPEQVLRHVGEEVALTLKEPFEGRKRFQGRLLAHDEAGAGAAGSAWRIVFRDGKAEQALDFTIDEVRELRLVPQVDFKGRRKSVPAPAEGSAEGAAKE